MYQLLSEQFEDNSNMSAENESSAPINGANNITAPEEPATTEPMTPEPTTVEEPVENQQQSMLAGEAETAGIWLVYDGNMMPNYGDEITVYIHSDPNLFCMGIIIDFSDDVNNITGAMNESDCNNYGC